MNNITNYLINVDFSEMLQDSDSTTLGAIGLLSLGGLAILVNKWLNPPHTANVVYGQENGYETLQIKVTGNLDTMPKALKDKVAKAVKQWQGPQGFKYFPTQAIPVHAQGWNDIKINFRSINGSVGGLAFSNCAKDCFFDHINTSDIDGHLSFSYSNNTDHSKHLSNYTFTFYANDKTPPEILEGTIQNVLAALKIED